MADDNLVTISSGRPKRQGQATKYYGNEDDDISEDLPLPPPSKKRRRGTKSIRGSGFVNSNVDDETPEQRRHQAIVNNDAFAKMCDMSTQEKEDLERLILRALDVQDRPSAPLPPPHTYGPNADADAQLWQRYDITFRAPSPPPWKPVVTELKPETVYINYKQALEPYVENARAFHRINPNDHSHGGRRLNHATESRVADRVEASYAKVSLRPRKSRAVDLSTRRVKIGRNTFANLTPRESIAFQQFLVGGFMGFECGDISTHVNVEIIDGEESFEVSGADEGDLDTWMKQMGAETFGQD